MAVCDAQDYWETLMLDLELLCVCRRSSDAMAMAAPESSSERRERAVLGV